MSETVLIEKEDWYKRLLKKLRELLAKQEKADLEVKLEIGKAIMEEKQHIKEPMKQFVIRLANDLGYSDREIWYCIEFAEKYQTIDDLIREYAKIKGVPIDTVSMDNLPAWRDIRNIILRIGMERYLKETKSMEAATQFPTQPTPQEGLVEKLEKMCQLEKDLHEILLILERKRSETLKCDECEIRAWCNKARPKILTVGTELADLEA